MVSNSRPLLALEFSVKAGELARIIGQVGKVYSDCNFLVEEEDRTLKQPDSFHNKAMERFPRLIINPIYMEASVADELEGGVDLHYKLDSLGCHKYSGSEDSDYFSKNKVHRPRTLDAEEIMASYGLVKKEYSGQCDIGVIGHLNCPDLYPILGTNIDVLAAEERLTRRLLQGKYGNYTEFARTMDPCKVGNFLENILKLKHPLGNSAYVFEDERFQASDGKNVMESSFVASNRFLRGRI